jgi:Tfp pilus assembly major pilin PilA
MSIILGTVFYLFLFVTEKRKKNKTISRCQEDKNVTQETKQKLINHTHVHSRHRHLFLAQAHGAWISFPNRGERYGSKYENGVAYLLSLILYQSKNCGHRIHVLFMMYDVYWYCQMKKKRMIMDNFGDSFDLFLFVTEKKTTKQTISRCQEDKNVTQETNQKLINHTHVHSRHRHFSLIRQCHMLTR